MPPERYNFLRGLRELSLSKWSGCTDDGLENLPPFQQVKSPQDLVVGLDEVVGFIGRLLFIGLLLAGCFSRPTENDFRGPSRGYAFLPVSSAEQRVPSARP